MTVHPLVSPRYYGYYIQGFREAFDWRMRLSTKGFPSLTDPKAGMAMILPEGQRVFVAANDWAFVDPQVLAWADLVGQVNVDPNTERSPKVLPLGPSFGTPWSSLASLASFVIRTGAMTSPARIPAMLRDYLRHQAERESLVAYKPGESDPTSIFFLANHWGNAPEANLQRLRYLRAIQRIPEVALEGGFWSASDVTNEYQQFRLAQRFSHADYLTHTRRSAVVFNTPAVHGCLGWKLGEFLALGKAIISTPLNREMPGRFVSGEHIHVVDGSEDAIVQAVELIVSDDIYRTTLERNARRYWEEFLAPASVARRILEAASQDGSGKESE